MSSAASGDILSVACGTAWQRVRVALRRGMLRMLGCVETRRSRRTYQPQLSKLLPSRGQPVELGHHQLPVQAADDKHARRSEEQQSCRDSAALPLLTSGSLDPAAPFRGMKIDSAGILGPAA
jgi:hypothetical protein